MKRTLAAFVAGLVLGAAMAAWLLGGASESVEISAARKNSGLPVPTTDGQDPHSDEIEGLRTELIRERTLSQQLSARVATLEQERADSDEIAAEADAGLVKGVPPSPSTDEPWFDTEALEKLRLPPGEIDRIHDVWERGVMTRLELENERVRQGQHSPRYALLDELEVATQVRSELGDDAYDAMLFATGTKNRVVFTELLESSPAIEAGLEAGDEVISYAGRRVFSPRDLKRLTATGRLGESVELRVQRGEDVVRIFVKRGPLGARLGMERRPPVL